MLELLFYLSVMLVASFVVWKGGSILESSAESLSRYYELSPIAHGSIVTAVGSSFPELSTTVLSTLIHGEFDLGVSAIVGSAIFNILVIPGLSAVMAKRIDSKWTFVVKDVQFYITSVVALLLVFALAVIYYPVEGSGYKGQVTREIALFPVLLYFLYLYLQQQETIIFRREKEEEEITEGVIGREWLKFGFSLLLIVLSVEGLVRGAIFLGDYFNTPNFVWGALVLAAATSVPDAIVSVREAMHEKGITSLANVIGSNVFDLLIAVPAGVLIAGSSVVDFAVAVPLMIFLSLATILLIFLLLRKDRLSRGEGLLLLMTYTVFVVWVILESIGVSNWIAG